MTEEKRRTYQPCIVGDKVMMPDDLERLHKELLKFDDIEHITDEMRAVIEELWRRTPGYSAPRN
jgi:hypothetical protein